MSSSRKPRSSKILTSDRTRRAPQGDAPFFVVSCFKLIKKAPLPLKAVLFYWGRPTAIRHEEPRHAIDRPTPRPRRCGGPEHHGVSFVSKNRANHQGNQPNLADCISEFQCWLKSGVVAARHSMNSGDSTGLFLWYFFGEKSELPAQPCRDSLQAAAATTLFLPLFFAS